MVLTNPLTMKTKILLFLIVIPLFLACEVNKTSNFFISEPDLIGTWNLTKMAMKDGSINGVSAHGETISGNCSIVSKDINMTFSFTDSPKMIGVEGSLTSEITTTHSSTMVITETFDTHKEPISSFDWKLNPDNTITVTRDPVLVFTIEEFSTNSLKLSTELNEISSFNGEPVTIQGRLNMVFEK